MEKDGVIHNVLVKDITLVTKAHPIMQGVSKDSPLKGNSRLVTPPKHTSSPNFRRSDTPVKLVKDQEIPAATFQKSMMQTFSEIDARLNLEKSGIVPSLAKISRSIDDSTSGLDAINLRLVSLEADVIHPLGFHARFEEIDQAIDNVKKDQIQIIAEESQVEVFGTRLSELNEKDNFLQQKMDLMAHTMQTQQEEIHSLKLSMASLVAINLSGNLFIGGIQEHVNEKCELLAAEFFTEKLELTPGSSDIIFAQRVGINGKLEIKGKQVLLPRIMKVECSPEFHRVTWSKKTLL